MSTAVWPDPLHSPSPLEITFDGHEGAYVHAFTGDGMAISNSATSESYVVAYSAFQLAEQVVLLRFIKPDPAHLVAVDVVGDLSVGSAFSVHQFIGKAARARPQMYVERGSLGGRFRVESMTAFPGWEHAPSRLQMSADTTPGLLEEEELDRRGRMRSGSGRALDVGYGLIALLRRGRAQSSVNLIDVARGRYTATRLSGNPPVVAVDNGRVLAKVL